MISIVVSVVVLVISVVIHEVAHGVAAYFLGDKTAYRMGRLSLKSDLSFRSFRFGCCSAFFGGVGQSICVGVGKTSSHFNSSIKMETCWCDVSGNYRASFKYFTCIDYVYFSSVICWFCR